MSGVKTGRTFSIAILAAMVLPCAGIAQTQQAAYQQNDSATSSSADPTANSSPANPDATSSNTSSPGGVSGGASSWTTGKGSFGITARTPGRSSTGATGGSWAAGSGSFGMKPQPGGIWRETGGGSMGTPNTAPTQSSAAKSLVPATFPGLAGEGPATGSSSGGAGSRRTLASRSPTGGHPTSGARIGASNGFRTGGSRPVGNKPVSLGAHRQSGSQSHAGPGHGSGAGSSSSHAKTQVPSAFAPSSPSAKGGTRQPDSGHDSIF
ncbi:MAG: hypothetical protein ABSA42_10770 [Terracidiphilus sp.]|jgi:hypothetical protein